MSASCSVPHRFDDPALSPTALLDAHQDIGRVSLEDAVLEELGDHDVLDRGAVHEVRGPLDVADVDRLVCVGVEEFDDDEIPCWRGLAREADAGGVGDTGTDAAFVGVEYLAEKRREQGEGDRGLAAADDGFDGAYGDRLEGSVHEIEITNRHVG